MQNTKIIDGNFQIRFAESRKVAQAIKVMNDGEGADCRKIKKYKEIRKELPALTFSGG